MVTTASNSISEKPDLPARFDLSIFHFALKGSSLARQANLNQAAERGVDGATMFVRTSKSSDAIIQCYAQTTQAARFAWLATCRNSPKDSSP
jgi:hypothetical protein